MKILAIDFDTNSNNDPIKIAVCLLDINRDSGKVLQNTVRYAMVGQEGPRAALTSLLSGINLDEIVLFGHGLSGKMATASRWIPVELKSVPTIDLSMLSFMLWYDGTVPDLSLQCSAMSFGLDIESIEDAAQRVAIGIELLCEFIGKKPSNSDT